MAASLQRFRGGLALQGSMVDDAACEFGRGLNLRKDPSMDYHITVLSKVEYRSVGMRDEIPTISIDHLYFIGAGGLAHELSSESDVYWVVCIWAAAAVWRKSLSLPVKDFHVTLTSTDIHGVSKNACSLLDSGKLTSAFPHFAPEKQDHVLHHLHSIRSDLILPLSVSCAIAHPDSPRHFVRVGDAAFTTIPKLSMLSYAHALRLDPSLEPYVSRRFRRLLTVTHYGPVMLLPERESIGTEIVDVLGGPWCADARRIGHNLMPLEPPDTLVAIGRKRLWYGLHELPRFFSWIVPYFLAGMSTPRCEQDVDKLAELGINRIVTLTEEEPLPTSWFAYKTVKNIFIPITNYKAPTFKEVDYFVDAVNEEETCWLVHCGGGKGRAGTFLACYIALYGFQKPDSGAQFQPKPCCDAGTVITWLRTMRPGSIESIEQEQFIFNWTSYRWKQKTDTLPEPTGLMSIQGHVLENPELVLLVGLPGSGKSWFSSALQKRKSGVVDVISQDESGSRALCETAVGRRQAGRMAILDRCNPSREDRRIWLALADAGEKAVAVYFDFDDFICTQRLDRRIHHPTIRAGRSFHATEQMKKEMTEPTLAEGFSAVITIPSFEAARQAIKLLGGEPAFYKFPRTQHLINLGAATADDTICDQGYLPSLGTSVVIEEKIDGANLGISLDYNGSLVVQNRSHIVTSRSHIQFRRLDEWLERHSKELHSILHRDEQFPERYILFGEWVFATHSIHYDKMPDLFLAFDFYDRVTKSFASREHLSRLLGGTSIHQVPIIRTCGNSEGVSEVELKSYMNVTSAFYDGPVEGVYVRFQHSYRACTLDRGKVVRADFISGSEHWAKGIIRTNGFVNTKG